VSAVVWALAAALPLAAPPKLLVNAQLETVSAAGGLEPVFRQLVTAQTQPGWIGYTAPLAVGSNLGCDYVSPGGWTAPGVIHLEPPDHGVILFRAEAGAVTRIRVLSPDCEIDAGGVPVHWIEGVRVADSTALLQTFAMAAKPGQESLRERAVYALSVSPDPGALDFIIKLARTDPNRRVRQLCVSGLARSKDPRAVSFFNEVFKP
jgi:hypothetical protein